MRIPGLHRTTIPPRAWAAMCGALLGMLTFTLCALLSRSGAHAAATLTAEAALLAALACIAAFAVFDGPTRLHRARVPIGRALPPSWWPRESDSVPMLAACAGAPLVLGAGAAVLLFR